MVTAIDLFAGLGGFTEGATLAGANVLWAANHWPKAVELHKANHPETSHVCQDLNQANWGNVPKPDIVLASPCCQGHSKARGKEEAWHDESRSTAWAVVSCCESLEPTAFVVENVVEFKNWKLFPTWKDAMSLLGYTLSEKVIDSADVGVPQERKRLFICGSKLSEIIIPDPTCDHQPIGKHIDWGLHNWSEIDQKVPATIKRAESGRERFGERFVMPYNGSGSGLTGRSIERPIGTVTCADRWAVVDGEMMRMLQVPEYKSAMGFRSDYELNGTKREQLKLLGNAVCPPVAEHIVSAMISAIN